MKNQELFQKIIRIISRDLGLYGLYEDDINNFIIDLKKELRKERICKYCKNQAKYSVLTICKENFNVCEKHKRKLDNNICSVVLPFEEAEINSNFDVLF
jgi:hypothetical protein